MPKKATTDTALRPNVIDADVEGILTELESYVPDDDINGLYGIRWQYEQGVIDKPLLEELRQNRQIQSLEHRVSPDMPKSSKRS